MIPYFVYFVYRFWYENVGVFNPEQLAQVKKTSLARVICDSSDILEVPQDVFRLLQTDSHFAACDQLPTVDLQFWIECPNGKKEKHFSPNLC